MKNHIRVTCGLIEQKGKFLIVQRAETSRHAFKWEFPGGKLEFGESLEECMARELKEELDIEVVVHKQFESVFREDGELSLELIPFFCEIVSGEITLLEHLDSAWIDIQKPIEQTLCAGDFVIAQKLADHQLKSRD